jgi:hypothetical protein
MKKRAACFLMLLSVVWIGCQSRKTGLVEVDGALADLVPADTVLLAGIRLDAIRATPAYEKWIGMWPSSDIDHFTEKTGIDPRKVSELLAASDGKASVILVKGNFSRGQIESKLSGPGFERMPYKGRTLIGSEEAAVVFFDSRTAAAGPAAALRSVIDQRNKGIPSALREKMKSISIPSQIWAVMAGGNTAIGETIPDSGNIANLRRIFTSLESSTIAVDVRSGLKAEATGVCRTEDDAKLIHNALRGLLGMGRLMTPGNQPEMLRLYDGIKVGQQTNSVKLEADVPMDVIDKLLARN